MKIVFVSNYINHHQLPVANELYEKLGNDYLFIQIEPMDEERIKMGWNEEFAKLQFLKFYYKEPELCQEYIDNADIVILGDEKNPPWILSRLKKRKPIFRYTERIYKEGQWKFLSPNGLIDKYKQHIKYRKAPLYLLCAGAYVASDFSLIHAYKEKKYNWGYFPDTRIVDFQELLEKKKHACTQILWAGRFINWKHPQYAVKLAHRLKEEGIDFKLTMVGDGELRAELEEKIIKNGLSNYVEITGFKKPKEVRKMMEEANIYLFTSDYKEGWGVVLNEAMNAGCAVVANCAIGSVPLLIKNKKNGLIYKNKRFDEFEEHVKMLIQDKEKQSRFGKAAYETIINEWNHKIAAERLLEICHQAIDGKPKFFNKGPLSEAVAIKPRKMYHYMQRE